MRATRSLAGADEEAGVSSGHRLGHGRGIGSPGEKTTSVPWRRSAGRRAGRAPSAGSSARLRGRRAGEAVPPAHRGQVAGSSIRLRSGARPWGTATTRSGSEAPVAGDLVPGVEETVRTQAARLTA